METNTDVLSEQQDKWRGVEWLLNMGDWTAEYQ